MRANLEGQQENRVVTTNVAMEVFALRRNSNVPVVRGFGSATAQLTNDTVFGITSIADLDPNATDMAIFFPNEVLQIADNLEGTSHVSLLILHAAVQSSPDGTNLVFLLEGHHFIKSFGVQVNAIFRQSAEPGATA